MHALLRRMSQDMQLAGLSQRTHDGYLREIRELQAWAQTAPDHVSEDQLRRYFLFLKNDCKYACGSLKVELSAFKFFFRQVVKRDWEVLGKLRVGKKGRCLMF